MILTNTLQKLQVFLAGAKATTDCPVVIDWVDFTTTATTPGMTPTNTNGVTTTDILAVSASSTQRKVNSVSLFNADTASVVVTIQINSLGTLYPVVSAMTVPAGSTLMYTDRRGWSVIANSGATQLSLPNNLQEFKASGTWTNPGGYRYALVECVGGGGGGGNGYFVSPDAGIGGGGGGGKRTRVLLNAGLLPVTVTITVGAGGPGGAATTAYNPGTAGGASSFGTYLYAYGGGGGTSDYSSAPPVGGGGGGGTSAGVTSTGGAAFAGASGISADDRGGAGNTGSGSYLGGGGGGGSGPGGYSWFSAGGGGGGVSLGGGAGSTTTTQSVGVTDVLGCGTGAGSQGYNNTGRAGGFPGGGGSGAYDSDGYYPAGGTGGDGVVRVWCW